jgi:hypothetical protein
MSKARNSAGAQSSAEVSPRTQLALKKFLSRAELNLDALVLLIRIEALKPPRPAMAGARVRLGHSVAGVRWLLYFGVVAQAFSLRIAG